ncbi:addiction module toxin RelE [Methylobacterium sp. Leaf456]|uniref:type II toxin-antitoxin system RelE/ParE family toxin n=1 Tax=Methylobacterium sp. Leaf456 TaxID=1736382 RepID=UPI0006FA3641|nr:type II toxin-antitoxin system RelE/ParE family toxin [Methylobacterium sp. Leaf456]KQT46507.1 addiction module toxin RelE [Methylobacterium sp. Leaf456]
MKRRTVGYAPAAAADLEWIYDTIAEASDLSIASRYEERIRSFCDNLAHAAERGTLRDDLRPGLRVVGYARRITVAFVVGEERVTILRLFYGGRNWEDDF